VSRGALALAAAMILTGLWVWADPDAWSGAEKMAGWMWGAFAAANGLYVWLLLLTWRRRNWARLAVIVWSVIGWTALFVSFLATQAPPLDRTIQVAIAALEIVGCQQLLSRMASSWYRSRATA